ncbi:hypothetical protein JW848_03770, partial [Candidatus Bipolaricaulota bacterium]|nr:hypothetical protein [Candidatus Bipolaricaulota bacterium]
RQMTAWAPPLHARVGIVANPKAGLGPDAVRDAVCRAVDALRHTPLGWRVVLLRDDFPAHAIAATCGTEIDLVASPIPEQHCNAASVAQSLLAADVDILVGIGGDGTLADIAAAILHGGRSVPLFGIGVGSSNVGPLISVHARTVTAETFGALDAVGVHGIEARCAGVDLGIAFNDVTFSNVYFGTRDGRRIDLGAAAHLRGSDRPTTPKSVCRETTYVEKNGRAMLDGKRHRLSQIVASPLNLMERSACAGKAVSGLMSWGPYLGRPAVLAGISDVAIRTQVDDDALADVEPLHLYQICFGSDDEITVGGLDRSAVIVLDGNPLRQMGLGESVVLKLRRDVLHVLRTPSSQPWERARLL